MSVKDAKIRNVGPKSAAWLRQVGVRSAEDLFRIGPVDVFLKVKRAGFRPSLNLLYSLAGAIDDCHWTDLPAERKEGLISDLADAESDNPIKTRWEKQADRSAEIDGIVPPSTDDSENSGFDDDGVRELSGTATDSE
ncbi:MAG TPA: TfoX/Sxy family protein [Dokdonella sp.]|uniref:TfoX/Sxy family protein n=1 Tax=Dokdonella sp. TaxID=2291710 RepID=UPI002D7F0002|nr:TfoX/Sxy family protein [Dokdonella sp.]HET9032299.1 TfoX/Sxy family protein [Dokdonella sp.]